jgi:hypothetical protein
MARPSQSLDVIPDCPFHGMLRGDVLRDVVDFWVGSNLRGPLWESFHVLPTAQLGSDLVVLDTNDVVTV